MKFLPLIAATLLIAPPALAQSRPDAAISPLGSNSALLSLTAEGQSRRAPDLAIFTAGVVTQGRNAAEALAENSRRMAAVVTALRGAGVPERDIQTSALSLEPRFSNPDLDRRPAAQQTSETVNVGGQNQTPRIVGYDARNSVEVRVRKMDDIGRVIDALVAAGANQVNGPTFTIIESKAALDAARTEAISAARQRAELYARAANMRVGRILSITEGGGAFPVAIQSVYGEKAGADAMPPVAAPVAAGEVTLGVTLSVQFELTR